MSHEYELVRTEGLGFLMSIPESDVYTRTYICTFTLHALGILVNAHAISHASSARDTSAGPPCFRLEASIICRFFLPCSLPTSRPPPPTCLRLGGALARFRFLFLLGLGMLSMYSGTSHPEARRTLAILSHRQSLPHFHHYVKAQTQ